MSVWHHQLWWYHRLKGHPAQAEELGGLVSVWHHQLGWYHQLKGRQAQAEELGGLVA